MEGQHQTGGQRSVHGKRSVISGWAGWSLTYMLALSVSISACSGDSETPTPTEAPATPTESPATPTEAPATPTATSAPTATPGPTGTPALDSDGDGYTEAEGDCNDDAKSVHPGASEVPYDGVDQDCSGADLTDLDSDGYDGGTDGDDCDDANPLTHPGASEDCDGVDDDCDGDEDNPSHEQSYYQDEDSDGYGATATAITACEDVDGYISTGGDCDDTSSAVNPGATETCDEVDNDCDGSTDEGTGLSGAVNYWSADGTANDTLGGANASTASVSYGDGKYGQGWYFDGTSSIVDAGNGVGNFGTGNFTIAFWAKSTEIGEFQGVGGKRLACNGSPMMDIRFDSRAAIEINESGDSYTLILENERPYDDAWHHYVFTRAGGVATLYIDGTFSKTTEAAATANVTSSAAWIWGRSTCTGTDSTQYFSGALDDMILFSRELSRSEISNLASGTVRGSCVTK